MTHSDLLHPALMALPDVTLAVDPTSLRVLDVNRAEAFGRTRDLLLASSLPDLLDLPRAEIAEFVLAADGRAKDLGIRGTDGALTHATARAANSAGAASRPCALVVLREAPEHARVLEEAARLHAILTEASEGLARLAAARRVSPPPVEEIDESALVEDEPVWVPELSLAQYASFCVEHELQPANARETDARYGMASEASRAELHRVWGERLKLDPALTAQFATLSVQYKEWYLAQQRAREATNTRLAAPQAQASQPPQPQAQTPQPPPVVQQPPAQSQLIPQPPSQVMPQPQVQAAPDAADIRKQQRTTAPSVPEPRAAALPWNGADAPAIPVAQQGAPPAEQPLALDGAPPSVNVRSTIGVNEALAQGHALPFRSGAPPDLTVEQFAALGVELDAYPDRRADVMSMYGITTEAAWRACDSQWTARFTADAALRQKWVKLSNDLRAKLVRK